MKRFYSLLVLLLACTISYSDQLHSREHRRGFSLYDGETLEGGRLGAAVNIGIPTAGARFGVGLGDLTDILITYDTMYSYTHFIGLEVKQRLFRSESGGFNLALRLAAAWHYVADYETGVISFTNALAIQPGVVCGFRFEGGHSLFAYITPLILVGIEDPSSGSVYERLHFGLGAEIGLTDYLNLVGRTEYGYSFTSALKPEGSWLPFPWVFIGVSSSFEVF